MTFRVETQNLTDKVGSPPIMDAKRSRRKGSKEEFSLETEGDPNNPSPPFQKGRKWEQSGKQRASIKKPRG